MVGQAGFRLYLSSKIRRTKNMKRTITKWIGIAVMAGAITFSLIQMRVPVVSASGCSSNPWPGECISCTLNVLHGYWYNGGIARLASIVVLVVAEVVVNSSRFRESSFTDNQRFGNYNRGGDFRNGIAHLDSRKKTALKAVFLSFQRRSLLGASLVCCAFLLMTAPASAQDTKTRRTMSGSSAHD